MASGFRRVPPLVLTSAAVGATAVVGALGTDVTSRWYRRLDKPRWQPPGPVFGLAWTPLYAGLAWASGRALARVGGDEERRRYWSALGANLVLNVGWTWVFFRGHRPGWAVVEILVLEASTLDLVRRAWRIDSTAGAALVPYAAWVAFATVLTAALARRNGAG